MLEPESKDVLLYEIEYKFLFYCSNLVVNGFFLISTPISMYIYYLKEIVQLKYQIDRHFYNSLKIRVILI